MLSHKLTNIFWGVLLITVSYPLCAGENGKQEAKRHFEVATRLYEVEDYKGAVTEFETSVRLYPTKNGYFNLANCYKALHRYEDALFAIEQLETRFEGKIDGTMRRKATRLKSLIASVVGEVTIYVDPLDAAIRLNGKTLPEKRHGNPVKLGPGEYLIEVSRDGYESDARKVTVYSQKKMDVRVALSPEKGTLTVRTDVDGATVVVDGEEKGATPLTLTLPAGEHLVAVSLDGYAAMVRTVETLPNEETTVTLTIQAPDRSAMLEVETKPRPVFPALKIAGIASTATAAVLSGVFYGLAAKYASDFKTYDDAYVSATNPQDVAAAEADALDAKHKTETFAAAGLAFAITAGALGVSTIVVTVVSKRLDKKEMSSRALFENGNLTVSF